MKPTIVGATAWLFSSLVLILGLLFKILSVLWHNCFKKLIIYYFSTSFNGFTTLYEDDKDAAILPQSLSESYTKKESQQLLIGHEETCFPYVHEDLKNQEIDLLDEIATFSTTFSDGDLAWIENTKDVLKLPPEEDALMKISMFDDVSFIDNSKIKNKRRQNQYRVVTGVEVRDHPLKKSISGFGAEKDLTKSNGCVLRDQSEMNLLDLNESSSDDLIGVKKFRNELFDSKLYPEDDILSDSSEGIDDYLEDLRYKEKLETSENSDGKMTETRDNFIPNERTIVRDARNSYSSLGAENKGSTEDLEELVSKINEIVDGRKVLEIVNGKLTLNDALEPKVKNNASSVSQSDSIKAEEFNKPNVSQVSKPNNRLITKPVFNFTSEDGKVIKNKLKRLFPPISMNKIFNRPVGKKSGSESELKTVSTKINTFRTKNNKCAEPQIENDPSKNYSKQNEFFAFTPSKWIDGNKCLKYAASYRGIELESSQKKSVPECDSKENDSLKFTPFKWTDDKLQSEDNLKDTQKNSIEEKLGSQRCSKWVLGCCSDCKVLMDSKQISLFDVSGIPHVKYNKSVVGNCKQGFCSSHNTTEDNKQKLNFDWGKTEKKESEKHKNGSDISQGSSFIVPSLRQRKRNGEGREGISKLPSDYEEGKRASEGFYLLPVYPLLKQADDIDQYSTGKSFKTLEKNNRNDLLGLDGKKKCIQNLYEKYMLSSADNEKKISSRTSNFAMESTCYRPLTEYSADEDENFETVDLSSPPRGDEDDVELIERPEKSLTFPAKMSVFGRQAEMAFRNLSINRMKLESKASINKLRAKLRNV